MARRRKDEARCSANCGAQRQLFSPSIRRRNPAASRRGTLACSRAGRYLRSSARPRAAGHALVRLPDRRRSGQEIGQGYLAVYAASPSATASPPGWPPCSPFSRHAADSADRGYDAAEDIAAFNDEALVTARDGQGARSRPGEDPVPASYKRIRARPAAATSCPRADMPTRGLSAAAQHLAQPCPFDTNSELRPDALRPCRRLARQHHRAPAATARACRSRRRGRFDHQWTRALRNRRYGGQQLRDVLILTSSPMHRH